jgi:acyl phosphate:glycerol-3-phosphate acyltransferase
MNYLISCIIGYLLGSFPTAYILIKKAKGIDVTSAGSGIVGAMNSYEISESKMIGFLVFFIDALKGLLSVYLPLLIFPVDFIYPALALLFAVLSHCYNPWLNFKGGRGLATAAGGSILLFPFMLVLWIILWLIIFLTRKDILLANIWANFMTLVLIFLSSDIAFKYSFPKADSVSTLLLFSSALSLLVFVRHIEPMKEIIKNKTFFQKGKPNV